MDTLLLDLLVTLIRSDYDNLIWQVANFLGVYLKFAGKSIGLQSLLNLVLWPEGIPGKRYAISFDQASQSSVRVICHDKFIMA